MTMINSKDTGLASDQFAQEKEYWLNRLAGEWSKGYLPYDSIDSRGLEKEETHRAQVTIQMPEQLAQQLLKLGNGSDQRLYMVLVAGVMALLQRYTGLEDLIIGAPIFKQGVAGGLLNTVLPLRNRVTPEMSFKEVLLEVRESLTQGVAHQNVPLEELLGELGLIWEKGKFPLFDLTVVLENLQDPAYIEDLECNLNLVFFRTEEGLQVQVDYHPGVYQQETVERMLAHLVNLFREAVGNLDTPLRQVEILSGEEREQIVGQFNDTQREFAADQTLPQLFEAQVARTPDRVAVHFAGESLTYRELNERANRLAHLLRQKGVGKDQLVGMLVERSMEMMIGVLGILKAGGAYLPIAPEYPLERIEYLLQDSGAQWLLTHTEELEVADFGGEVLALKGLQLDQEVAPLSSANLEVDSQPTDLAYVIYTSGSTGKPKGAMIEHRSAINRLSWMQNQYQLTETDVILQKTPYTFDVSVWELFWWSIYGAQVCFLEPGGEKDPQALVQAIEDYQITTMHFVPSMLSSFLKYVADQDCAVRLQSLRQVFASGEALKVEQVERFRNLLYLPNGTRLHNLYGPTEATVDVSYYDCFADEERGLIPIGRPIDNIQLLILDRQDRLQPIGIPGELCIAGVGVGRGYLNRPELTSAKFVPHPLVAGERMYRTGDLARWLSDGQIEYLGRIDHQVKIRGYRIELGEIESQLNQHPGVAEAVVHTWANPAGEENLVAYIISERELSIGELKGYLAQFLPEYMIPAYFVRIEELPLSANGKLDRKALPAPDGSMVTGVEYQAPRDQVERRLAEIWIEILQLEQIGIYDNFFDLGGHSLRVTELVSQVYRNWGVEISLKEIFNLLTIEKLAAHIRQADPTAGVTISVAEEQPDYPMSSAQQRMFVLNQLMGPNTVYNLPLVFKIEGELDQTRLERVWQQLIQRHEVFRTSFALKGDEGVQQIHPAEEIVFQLDYREIGEEQLAETMHELVRPFDLSQPPLIRGCVVKLGESSYQLIIDLHHIIFDGVSAGVLMEEFTRLYNGEDLEPLRIQYKDYAVWQNQYLQSELMQEQEQYWLQELAQPLPTLELPYDFPRPARQVFTGAGVDLELSEELTGRLKELAETSQTSLFMVLLSIYGLFLAKCSGQEDLIIGTPIAGRSYLDLQQLIGMFVNTLPLRLRPVGAMSYREYLKEVKETALQGYENQDYQIEELVSRLQLDRQSDRNPLFDVTFTMQNMHQKRLSELQLQDELTITPVQFQNSTAKFDLALFAVEMAEGIFLRFEYSTQLFTQETVQRFSDYFHRLAVWVTEHPEVELSQMEILDAEEVGQISNQIEEQQAQVKESFELDFDF